jgi:hypothetical protein
MFRFVPKPLRIVKPDPKDPTWTFPYASRQRIENIRAYMAHFATRLEGWKQNPRTHALPAKQRRPDIPWYSVPVQHRQRVQEWFDRKIAELHAKGVTITAGKIQSLRMNATVFGRYVLTGKRSMNRMHYELNKRIWLAYLDWQAKHEKKEIDIERPATRSKMLELA